MSIFERGEGGIYRCSAFDEFPWQQHGFGTRVANPPVQVTLRQVHSNIIRNARGLQDREAEGDGLITDGIGTEVGIRTADCVPILLLDRSRRAVGAVHAGWRGTAAHIVLGAVRALQDQFGSEPADILAAIGPCIRQCCYEVDAEVARQFSKSYKTESAGPSKWKLNLAGTNRNQAIEGGILPDHIFDLGACTMCGANDFFSYRREPENPGRMLSSIARIA